jgi:hypothetical protein
MSEVLTFLFTLFGNGHIIEKIDYCELDVDHLSLENKIEMAMGCSTVNGKNVYHDSKLKSIYEQGERNE